MVKPASVAATGDDSPARSLWGYVWRMSGAKQLGLCALALAVTALNLAPVELQRRLIDDAIAPGDAGLLWTLGLLYAGAVLAHQGLKFVLQSGQSWLGESATSYTRAHLLSLYDSGRAGRDTSPGEAASILGPEVEKLGGFVGAGPSGAFTDASMLLGVAGYMLWVEPQAAMLALALIAPQVLLAPLMQQRLNRLMGDQVGLARDFGGALGEPQAARMIAPLYANRMAINIWKQGMKSLMNLLNAAAPVGLLIVGGLLVIDGQTTLGVLVAFLSAVQRMAEPIRNLIGFYRLAAQANMQHGLLAVWMQPPVEQETEPWPTPPTTPLSPA